MECPKCGGIMIYNKRKDILMCLSCFYRKIPNDRVKKVDKYHLREEEYRRYENYMEEVGKHPKRFRYINGVPVRKHL